MVAAAAPPEPVKLLPPMDPREQDRGAKINQHARPVVGPEGPRPLHLLHIAGLAFRASIGPTLALLPDGRRLRLAECFGHAPARRLIRGVVLIPTDPDGPRWTVAAVNPHDCTVTVRPHLPPGLLADMTVPDPDAPGGREALAAVLAAALAPLPVPAHADEHYPLRRRGPWQNPPLRSEVRS
ncbi:hypothetical protein [Alienimonas sp. DA493]|uniref:hypothetical protein n=1 Tax=Alienimonas sp. DA493 TaxID=3373605 RepID=UPI0037550174